MAPKKDVKDGNLIAKGGEPVSRPADGLADRDSESTDNGNVISSVMDIPHVEDLVRALRRFDDRLSQLELKTGPSATDQGRIDISHDTQHNPANVPDRRARVADDFDVHEISDDESLDDIAPRPDPSLSVSPRDKRLPEMFKLAYHACRRISLPADCDFPERTQVDRSDSALLATLKSSFSMARVILQATMLPDGEAALCHAQTVALWLMRDLLRRRRSLTVSHLYDRDVAGFYTSLRDDNWDPEDVKHLETAAVLASYKSKGGGGSGSGGGGPEWTALVDVSVRHPCTAPGDRRAAFTQGHTASQGEKFKITF